jgi:hypothetical protein
MLLQNPMAVSGYAQPQQLAAANASMGQQV